MKKIIACLMTILMLAVLSACGPSAPNPSPPAPESEFYEFETDVDYTPSTFPLSSQTGQRFTLKNMPQSKLNAVKDQWLLSALENNPLIINAYRTKTGFKTDWFGEFSGKLLMSMVYAYNTLQDNEVLAAGNKLVDELADVQEADGYLGPFNASTRMLAEGLGNKKWDFWGHAHNILALYRWYESTGNEKAKQTALKAADYIIEYMSKNDRRYIDADWSEMNLAVTYAFAYLYTATSQEKYLTEALRIIDIDWKQPDKGGAGTWAPGIANWYQNALDNKDFFQGERRRWEALYAVMSLGELYKATGNENYYNAFEQIWWSIRKTDIHNCGSFSSAEQARNGAFNNVLPIETCCTIAWMEFSVDYLKLSRNSYIADELELSTFNANYAHQTELSGESKQYFTYDTPMDGSRLSASEYAGTKVQAEIGAPDVSCCQLSGAKGSAMIGEWGLLHDENGVFINYYGAGAIQTKTPSGQSLTINQTTSYPVSGKISFSFEIEQAEKMDVNFRIPYWSAQTKMTINGKIVKEVPCGNYIRIRKAWSKNDKVEIELEMAPHYLRGESSYSGYASIYYGPVMMGVDMTSETTPLIGKLTDSALKSAKISYGADSWITADVTVDGNVLTLNDFASVGKGINKQTAGKAYISWFELDGLVGITFCKKGMPQWGERIY